ncbi:hypothetical protein EQP59_00380 [Ornithobacterium rhinotracheale]|uniref:Uncharacterized protein n=1 Tax=Ornithobacterium rhinotracheale TaxID=28251 RepID=A0A3R5Y224_ORNRH|nr:DUF1796 family putative cysteine peptidase [Ornithobacterium rhinotracheale]QAR29922.1 hypothetical protein EQP59_00380 [Ornithobacterium rhinotracheale]
MRIPIFYNPISKSKKFLHIDRNFNYEKTIIPIGSDCHTAHVIEVLHLRDFSLPFDYMGSGTVHSINFVCENINNNFKYFIDELTLNERNIVTSKVYPEVTFMHFPKIIENEKLRETFRRRIKRFYKVINDNQVHFINGVPSNKIYSYERADIYFNGIIRFMNHHLKQNDKLSAFIRYDENKEFTGYLAKKLENLVKEKESVFYFCKYIRQTSKYPTWGNPKYYPKLLKDLGFNIKETLPKIYIK